MSSVSAFRSRSGPSIFSAVPITEPNHDGARPTPCRRRARDRRSSPGSRQAGTRVAAVLFTALRMRSATAFGCESAIE
jgi:hypothetical protein